MNELLTLRQKQAKLVHDTSEIVSRAATEGRGMNEAETTTFENLTAEFRAVGLTIERIAEADQMRAAIVGFDGGTAPQSGAPSSTTEARSVALRNWFARGEQGLTAEQRASLAAFEMRGTNPLGEGTTTLGGFTVPIAFVPQLEIGLKWFSGMRQVATLITTDGGQQLQWPTFNDTGNSGSLLSENTGATVLDTTFGQVTFNAYKFTSGISLVSLELLQDSAVDVNGTVMNMLGVRLGRAANAYLTTGTGISQPKGIVTAATLGKTGLTGQTTSVIYADLVDLLFSVDKAYRDNPGAGYMMNDSTFKAILKLQDSQNRPLILPYGAPLAGAIPVSLFGKPITINNDMPVMAANAKSILYGDFSKYMIRQLMQINIQRLVERYAELGQVGFIGLMRLDGQLLDAGTHPVCYYANSAT